MRPVALLCCLLLCLGSSAAQQQPRANPARHVTIATLGPRALVLPADTAPQAIVDRMKSHWKGRLAQVLPDKPDLIVLPEACDRPGGISQDRLL